MGRGDEGAHLGRVQGWLLDAHPRNGRLQERHEAIEDRALHEDARSGAAVLAGVVEDAVRRRRRSALEIGVGEDDVGALATQFERHPLDLRRAAGHDPLAHLGRSGEDDLAHERMSDEALTHHRPLAGDDREDALGDACLESKFAEADGRQRRHLCGLEHDGAAGSERRRKAPARDRHGEVPRNDDADDADRLVERHVDPTGHRDLPAEEPLGCSGVVREHVADIAGLPAGIADGVTGVGHLELRELLDVVVDHLTEAAKQPRAVTRRDVTPGGERRVRTRDEGVDLLDRGRGDIGDLRPTHGADDGGHRRSNPRYRSQSVTARPKASNSTRPILA